MLPSNSSSSIQKRRLLHRRQQSLEVPILATSLQTNHRRTQPARSGHRRGLSLDQSLSAISSPTGFRPLPPQDTNNTGLPIGSLARTTQDTNPGLKRQSFLDQQHSNKQETQEHSLAQPGFPSAPLLSQQRAPNFHSHLHQQLNGMIDPSVTPTTPDQAVAIQHLQNHMAWYQATFGRAGLGTSMQAPDFGQSEANSNIDGAVYMMGSAISFGASNHHSHTVPNTPQNFSAGWPSPPSSQMKQARSQSYQLDVAPMPQGISGSAFASSSTDFTSDKSFVSQAEHDYATSNYSSSVADASSPPQQHSTPLPTLFEEASSSDEPASGGLLLHAAAGAELDFNSPNFVIGSRNACAEQAALDNAGIDATYIDNGITEEHINSFLTVPVKKGDPYICTYQNCGAKVNRKENARAHVQNHLDDRKYQCNVCDKRFTRSHDTKRHAMTHTNDRPAICPCGRSFARADALTRHRQRDMCVGVLPGYEKDPEDKPKRGRPKKDRSGQTPETGRKRTSRPDMSSRAHKASLARAIDAANRNGLRKAASASSARSERSLPDTPPHDADSMDAHGLLDMDGADGHYNHSTSSWLDTPPTSPLSLSASKANGSMHMADFNYEDCVSPSKLSARSSPPPALTRPMHRNSLAVNHSSPATFHHGFHGGSSPIDPNADLFNDSVNFDVMNSHPDVGYNVFSPAGESCSNSSVYNSDFDPVHVSRVKAKPTLPTIYDDRRVSDKQALNNDLLGDGLEDFANAVPYSDQYDAFKDMLDTWIAHN